MTPTVQCARSDDPPTRSFILFKPAGDTVAQV